MKLAFSCAIIFLCFTISVLGFEGDNCLCCKTCLVCQPKCEPSECKREPTCPCVLPHKEFQCPEGFTWNGAACMQDYANQIKVDMICGCVHHKCEQ